MNYLKIYWKQNQSPVGRTALCPTLIYLPKPMVVQWKFSYQFFINMKHLFYANFCRTEGSPTYGFFNMKSLSAKLYFLPISFRGALTNSTLPNHKRGNP